MQGTIEVLEARVTKGTVDTFGGKIHNPTVSSGDLLKKASMKEEAGMVFTMMVSRNRN